MKHRRRSFRSRALSSKVGVTVRTASSLFNRTEMMSMPARLGALSPYLPACGPLKALLPRAVNTEVLVKSAVSGR